MAHAGAFALIFLAPALAGCLGGDDATPPQEGPAAPPEPFTFAGRTCEEAGVILLADAATVSGFVPPQFTMVGESTGRVSLLVASARCETLAPEGAAELPGQQSDVGVAIDAADGSDGMHFYQMWFLTNEMDLRARFDDFAVLGGLVPNMTYERTEALPASSVVDAEVPWGDAGYGLSVSVAGAPAPFPLEGAVWWHLGSAGLVRISYTFDAATVRAGPGTVTTEAHTPLGHILGGASADGSGLLAVYGGYTARVEIVEPASPT